VDPKPHPALASTVLVYTPNSLRSRISTLWQFTFPLICDDKLLIHAIMKLKVLGVDIPDPPPACVNRASQESFQSVSSITVVPIVVLLDLWSLP